MSQIFHNIWITPANTAREKDFLLDAQITHILNCAEEEHPFYPLLNLQVMHIPMTDDNSPEGKRQILEGAEVMAQWFKENAEANVIVHCKAGISRSVTVVLAWMIIYKNYKLDEAYNYVVSKRNFICPNEYYWQVLKELEEEYLV